MAVTILPSGIGVRCQPVPLTVEWHVDGIPSSALDLHVEYVSGAGAVTVRPLRPGQFLLPLPTEPVVVIARPVGGHAFPNGAFLEVRLRTPGDAAEYVLADADLSGTSEARLASIEPTGGLLLLTAEPESAPAPPEPAPLPPPPVVSNGTRPGQTDRMTELPQQTPPPWGPSPTGPTATGQPATGQPLVDGPGPGFPAHPPSVGGPPPPVTPPGPATPSAPVQLGALPELARRTNYACRRQIDGSRLPASQLRDVVVAVDRSASMLPAVRGGALTSLLEILLGLATVVGREPLLPVWQLGAAPRPVRRAVTPDTVAGFVAAELSEQASLSGVALTPLVDQIGSPARPTSVFVITDGVPPDTDVFASVVAGRSAPVSWHLLALARSGTDPRVSAEPWADELTALRRDGWASVAALSPEPHDGWVAERLADDRQLDLLVADLFPWPPTARTGVPAGQL